MFFGNFLCLYTCVAKKPGGVPSLFTTFYVLRHQRFCKKKKERKAKANILIKVYWVVKHNESFKSIGSLVTLTECQGHMVTISKGKNKKNWTKKAYCEYPDQSYMDGQAKWESNALAVWWPWPLIEITCVAEVYHMLGTTKTCKKLLAYILTKLGRMVNLNDSFQSTGLSVTLTECQGHISRSQGHHTIGKYAEKIGKKLLCHNPTDVGWTIKPNEGRKNVSYSVTLNTGQSHVQSQSFHLDHRANFDDDIRHISHKIYVFSLLAPWPWTLWPWYWFNVTGT